MSTKISNDELMKQNTDLKRKVLELKKYKQAFLHANDGMAISNGQGNFVAVNYRLCQDFGYSPEELLNKTCKELKDSSLHKELQKRSQLLHDQGSLSVETVYLHKDGTNIPVELNASVFQHEETPLVIIVAREISKRKKKEKLLQRYKELCSVTDDLMFFIDKNYVYQFVNDACGKLFELNVEDLIGCKAGCVVGEEVFNSFFKNKVDRCFAGETIRFQQWLDYPFLPHAKYMDIIFYPFRDFNNIVTGAIAIAHDLTDLKLVETSKLQERNRFQHILNNISDGVLVVDNNFNVIHGNTVLQNNFGTIIEGQKCYQYLHKKDSPCYRCNKSQVLEGKTDQWEMAACAGNKIYTVYETPFELPDGQLLTISFFRDITEKRQAERQLEEKNKELRILINTSPDLICFKNETGRWLLANDAVCDLFNLSQDEIIGKKDSELPWISPFNNSDVFVDKNNHLSGKVFRGDKIIPFANGEIKTFDILEVPLFCDKGKSKGFIGIGRDITGRVEAEDNLRKEMKAHRRALKELAEKNTEIKNANIALGVLLEKHKDAKSDVEEQIMMTLKKLVLPYVDLLKQCTVDPKKREYLTIITSHIYALMDSFVGKLSYSALGLTKKEILVADLIRNNKKTSEIASLLNLSTRSIEAHRNNLRKKLKLTGKKESLKQHLCQRLSSKS